MKRRHAPQGQRQYWQFRLQTQPMTDASQPCTFLFFQPSFGKCQGTLAQVAEASYPFHCHSPQFHSILSI